MLRLAREVDPYSSLPFCFHHFSPSFPFSPRFDSFFRISRRPTLVPLCVLRAWVSPCCSLLLHVSTQRVFPTSVTMDTFCPTILAPESQHVLPHVFPPLCQLEIAVQRLLSLIIRLSPLEDVPRRLAKWPPKFHGQGQCRLFFFSPSL